MLGTIKGRGGAGVGVGVGYSNVDAERQIPHVQ